MLKNRELVIKLNKINPEGEPTTERRLDVAIFEDKVAILDVVTRKTLKTMLIGVCGYVVLDTLRQILVSKTTNIPIP